MTHTADNTDACLCTWGQSFEGELLGVTQRITATNRRCPEHGLKPRHASTADNTDRQENATVTMPIKPLTPESYTYARTVGRCNRLSNARHYGSDWDKGGQVCNDGNDHQWQPVSFVFETQLLDGEGRVRIRQPNISEGRVYVVCMGCRSHTYVVTEWVGYFLGGPGDGEAGPDPVLGSPACGTPFDEDDDESSSVGGTTTSSEERA